MKLSDKVAIVTGASQGIGESIAKRYAKEGAKVAVNYSKSDDKANKVVADRRRRGKGVQG
jgi:NAD(P)-dependent dehydrogenase (short-subunit alcohol dehydrogenase family)